MAKSQIKPYTEQQKQYVRLVVANKSEADILMMLFGVDVNSIDKAELNRYRCRLYRWKNHPDYDKEWRKAWREAWGKLTYQAMDVIREGMADTALPWRRTQSANLAITYGSKTLVGEDSNTVKVQVSGLPDLGTPDGDDV